MHETPFLRIALLTDGIFPFVIGGMQKHSYYLCRFLLNLGVELTLFHCVTSGEVPSEEEVREALQISENAQFKSICIRFPKGNGLPGHYLRSSFLYSKMQADQLKKEAPFDFVYSKGFAAWALLDEKKRGKFSTPIGVKFHGYEMYQAPPNFKAKLQYLMLRGPVKFCNTLADAVFSYGGKITPIVNSLGVADENIIEIPTGIESKWLREDDRKLKLESDTKKLLFLGRYERRKGIEELNDVLTKILDTTRFEVSFIGPIPPSKHIQHERVTYHGKIMDQERIQEIMDQNDILLTPSHSEGMPNVIMEGMARSMAILATDVGAVSLQVNDKNGWLIEAANSQALEQALLEIDRVSPEDLLSKQAESRKKIIQNFTWEAVSSSTLEAIRARYGKTAKEA